MEPRKLSLIIETIKKEYSEIMTNPFDDLSNEEVYHQHADLVCACGHLVLAKERKQFVVDKYNKDILRFLLYYFNNNPEAENVFPGKGHKLHKNLMVCGEVGVGKTLIMEIFAEYLKKTRNPNSFINISVTEMINYYKVHNHLDKYTYNENSTNKIEGAPLNVCLNDVGLQTHLHFGTDTKVLVADFFHARNEIWMQYGMYAHITTNLTATEIKEYFHDEHGRLEDRFKTYNVIHLKGKSRR
ncbi:MAG: ATP-binding protein [Tannerellaceae bacterium]|nr:ATP-binding protein [Tannerellaceae bacterium]